MMKNIFKSIFKKILSENSIARLQGLRERIDIRVAALASRHDWLAVLYYSFYSAEFRREMSSVLLARKRYYESRLGHNPGSFLLRRNIHRLEKGLIMQPRRLVFAEGYIGETIAYFRLCVEADCLSEIESNWAHAVIHEYFSIVELTDVIAAAHLAYRNITGYSQDAAFEQPHAPLAYSALPPSAIGFDDLKALCERRHSVRWFEEKAVPREMLDAAIDVAATAPSACNRQPFQFYIFDDPTRAQKIGSIPMGTAGFSQNFQAVIVVVGDLSAYPFEKDRHIIYIDSGLAVMQLQLALECQGLGSCAINWPDIDRHERRMAKELALEPYQRPVMLLAVGYPKKDALVPYSAKKTSVDLVVRP